MLRPQYDLYRFKQILSYLFKPKIRPGNCWMNVKGNFTRSTEDG